MSVRRGFAAFFCTFSSTDTAALALARDFAALAAFCLPLAASSRGRSRVSNAAHVMATKCRRYLPKAVVVFSKRSSVVSVCSRSFA